MSGCAGAEASLIERVLFGNRLRLARERRRLSLDQIAHDTKLSASVIAALEDGSCARWPIGLYSRAYVRTYAELVGLDPAETVGEFALLFPEVAFLDVERAAARGDRDAVGAAHRAPGAPVAALRLIMEETPAPWWRRLMTTLAWWLHRVANGGVTPTLEGHGAAGDWLPDSREEAASFAALQVDHD